MWILHVLPVFGWGVFFLVFFFSPSNPAFFHIAKTCLVGQLKTLNCLSVMNLTHDSPNCALEMTDILQLTSTVTFYIQLTWYAGDKLLFQFYF